MSFNYDVNLGDTKKNKWGNMANSIEAASLIIYNSKDEEIFNETKTNEGD